MSHNRENNYAQQMSHNRQNNYNEPNNKADHKYVLLSMLLK